MASAAAQGAFFDDRFAAQADSFTMMFEELNVRRRIASIQRHVAGGRALEIGIGRGVTLAALHRGGFDVVGLDLSDAVCVAARERLGVRIYGGCVEEFARAERPKSFDLIVMSHVLEHMKHPGETIACAAQLLKTGGVLYVAVPNVLSWNARLTGWVGYQPYHIHYFSEASLRQLFESTGLNVLRCSTYEPLTGWVNALFRSYALTRSTEDSVAPFRRRCSWLRTCAEVFRLSIGVASTPLRMCQSALGYGEELVAIGIVRDAAW